MKIEYIEALLVCLILFFQIRIFYQTFRQIGLYQIVLPMIDQLKIRKHEIALAQLEEIAPSVILEYLDEPFPDEDDNNGSVLTDLNSDNFPKQAEKVSVSLLVYSGNPHVILDKILFSMNTYLIRNFGSATDFHLVKDIVERNVNALEEDINLTISIPLYLGLMGTMLGIVIGLFNIPDLSLVLDSSAKDMQLNMGIGLLIGGVKVAMIASFTGLLLTIINSGWVFKGARTKVEANKNEFYTYIQTELLPVLNQSLGSTIISLQRNLQLFNAEFTGNLNKLSGIFHTNYDAITAQERVLSKLETIDIAQIAKFNINVLKQLQQSTGQLEQFNSYLQNMNGFVENSRQLTVKAGELLERTDHFETIAVGLESRLKESQLLFDFLSRHFQQLESHKNLVNSAVADVGYAIADTFGDLKGHIQSSTNIMKEFSIQEMDALKTALAESRTNLSNLSFLESLNQGVSQIKSASDSQHQQIQQMIKQLNMNMEKSIGVLESIQQASLAYKAKGFSTSVRRWFIKDKDPA